VKPKATHHEPLFERRLVPILSLDVDGFTRLIERNETESMRAVSRLFKDEVEAKVGRDGGTVFKTMGDGMLIEFTSVVNSVNWAARLLQKLHDEPVSMPGGEVLKLRIGIVLADVMIDGKDRFGTGVNLAVRIENCAPAGGLAVTKWIREFLDGRTSLTFTDIGSQLFKNVSHSIRVFIWHPDSVAQQRKSAEFARASKVPAMPSGRPSLVVLPFENLSSETGNEHVADGVVEEVTSTLSRIGDILVIARNSAFAYKGRNVDVRQVGRELGVRYALEGSVRKAGQRLRITAQLVETETGAHIWAGREEGQSGEIFDLQDRIAELVAGAVHPSVRSAEVERARTRRPDSLEAYDLVMRALPHLWAHRMFENPQAIALLTKALETDPNYGLAAALCAWSHAQQIVYNWTDNVERERAAGMRLIEKAARHLGEDATGLTALATAVMLLEGNAGRALPFVERALSIDPNHSWAWTRRGFGLVYTNRPDEAIASFTKAQRLSPLDPFAFNMRIGMGLAHFTAGRFQEASRYPKIVLDERPGMTWPYRDLAAFLGQAGDIEGAQKALAEFVFERPPVSLASLRDSLRFMQQPLLDLYIEGLRKAGMA
jgi:adenylate cyclase